MKKILSTLAALFVISTCASAFTWSGLIDNTSRLSSSTLDSFNFYQTNGIYLSLNVPVTKNGGFRFSTEGMYKYTFYSFNNNAISKFTNIADLTLCKVDGNLKIGNNVLSLSAGRFSYSDFTLSIFSQPSDGLYLSYNTTSLKLAFYAGYTGLINSFNVIMLDASTTSNEQFYNLCPGYIPLSADFSYKTLFGSNNLGLQAFYFLDPKQELGDKFYGTLSLSGPISSAISYKIQASLGSEKFENLMLYSTANLYYYLGNFAVITAGGEYASGENGPFTYFKTITSHTAYYANGGTETTALLMPKLSAMFVFGKLYANISEKIVFTLPSSEITLQGSDTVFSLLFNVMSDLQIGSDIIAYIDFNTSSSNYYAASLKASLSF